MTDAEASTPVAQDEASLALDVDSDVDLDPEPGEHGPRWVRNLVIGMGVPLVAAGIFVVLVLTGVIRDGQRADYCRVYAETSAPLVPLYSQLEDALALGDPGTILSVTLAVRENIDALDVLPATPRIDVRLVAMTDYLRRVEVAARAHDEELLSALAQDIASFRFARQAFLSESAEYCRYR
jgi:hypothetical protein